MKDQITITHRVIRNRKTSRIEFDVDGVLRASIIRGVLTGKWYVSQPGGGFRRAGGFAAACRLATRIITQGEFHHSSATLH